MTEPKTSSEPTTPVEDVARKAATRQNTFYLMWEVTQSIVAISLVIAVIVSTFVHESIPETLNNALFIVMGFYFGRTNHARTQIEEK